MANGSCSIAEGAQLSSVMTYRGGIHRGGSSNRRGYAHTYS